MKDVRPEFTPDEYEKLRRDADLLSVPVKRLVHDRALGISTNENPLSSAQILSDEISLCRKTLNEIIQRETSADVRLYEDDVIRLEMTMNNIETMVAAYITQAIKAVKKNGNIEI